MRRKTVVLIAVIAFVAWLLFRYAPKKAASSATTQTVNPSAGPAFDLTLSYP